MYSVLGALEPRAAAAPVAPPLEIDGYRLWRSRRHSRRMRGSLPFHGTRHVELNQLPKMNEEIEREVRKDFLSVFFNFPWKCLLGLFTVRPIRCKLNWMKKTRIESRKIIILVKAGPNHVRYTNATLFSWLWPVSPNAAYITAFNWWNNPNPTTIIVWTRNGSMLLRSTTPKESLETIYQMWSGLQWASPPQWQIGHTWI